MGLKPITPPINVLKECINYLGLYTLSSFHVTNGVKHKAFYLQNCLHGDKGINHLALLMMLLVSLSSAGMQSLLTTCQEYALSHDLLFNSTKSMCMDFSS